MSQERGVEWLRNNSLRFMRIGTSSYSAWFSSSIFLRLRSDLSPLISDLENGWFSIENKYYYHTSLLLIMYFTWACTEVEFMYSTCRGTLLRKLRHFAKSLLITVTRWICYLFRRLPVLALSLNRLKQDLHVMWIL